MTTRLIRLRRPANLSIVEEPFVPDDVSLDEIDRRWQAAQRDNPHLYDGQLLHVIGVHRNGYGGAVVHVAPCSYRFHAVQRNDFDLGVRALGVKGITQREGGAHVLLGKRSPNVMYYPGLWEFAPGGVVEPHATPADTVRNELKEETGLSPAREPVALAIVYDEVIRCWELVFHLVAAGELNRAKLEYEAIQWVKPGKLPRGLSPIAQQIQPLLTCIGQ